MYQSLLVIPPLSNWQKKFPVPSVSRTGKLVPANDGREIPLLEITPRSETHYRIRDVSHKEVIRHQGAPWIAFSAKKSFAGVVPEIVAVTVVVPATVLVAKLTVVPPALAPPALNVPRSVDQT